MLEAYIAAGVVVLVGLVIYHDTAYLKTLDLKEPSGVINLTGFIALMSLITAVGSLSIAKYQANLASEVFYENSRPWLGQHGLKFSGIFNAERNDGLITINMTLENYGHSPANGVVFIPEFFYGDISKPVDPYLSSTLVEERRFCGSLMSPNFSKSHVGTTIFPGNTLPLTMKIQQRKADEYNALQITNEHLARLIPGLKSKFNAVDASMIGCILYRGMKSTDYHLTPIIIDISYRNPQGILLEIDPKQTDLPISSLAFSQSYVQDPPS